MDIARITHDPAVMGGKPLHPRVVTIMAWARANRRCVFTHDLDFGHLLALTHADGPSVRPAPPTPAIA